MIAKSITATSWILTSRITGKKIGLAIKKDNIFKLVQNSNKEFNSLEEIAQSLGESLVFEKEKKKVEEDAINDIDGYPIKHAVAVDINSDKENNLHTYKLKETGKITFVAGYFGVKFKSGYVSSFCPKIETLLENEYIGPYKNKFDMQFHLLKHNRES